MSAPDLLERTRMALAEAGYPNAVTRQDADGEVWITTFGAGENDVPSEVVWRTFEVVGTGDPPLCLACYMANDRLRCLADRPLVRDCGASR